jgi:hypothetical protein
MPVPIGDLASLVDDVNTDDPFDAGFSVYMKGGVTSQSIELEAQIWNSEEGPSDQVAEAVVDRLEEIARKIMKTVEKLREDGFVKSSHSQLT